MEQRLKTLAKTLHDAANEAEKCCEYHKEMVELQSVVNSLKYENDSLLRKLKDMSDKEEKYKAAIAEEKLCSSNLKIRLEESLLKQNEMIFRNKPHSDKNSDQLRPTKVAEIYQELYDNQWTDAYEILDPVYAQEEKTIEQLLQVLKNVFEFCKTMSKQQNDKLQHNLLLSEKKIGDEFPNAIQWHVECCKKELSSVTVENIFEIYISNINHSRVPGMTDILKIKPFVKECIKTCWLCVIQNPPLHIDLEPNARGKTFNTDAYRPCTRTGSHIDYIVWPTLLYSENGPVLTKGIAQGTKKSTGLTSLKQKVVYQSDVSGTYGAGLRKRNLQYTESTASKNTGNPLIYERKSTPQRQYGNYVFDPDRSLHERYRSEPNFASKYPAFESSKNYESSYGTRNYTAYDRGRQGADTWSVKGGVVKQPHKEVTRNRESRQKSAERRYRDPPESGKNKRMTRSKSTSDLSR